LGWGWLLSVWGLGILFVVGVSLLLWALTSKGADARIGVLVHHRLIWAWLKRPRQAVSRGADATIVWKPYRSARRD